MNVEIHPTAIVSPDAKLSEGVKIGPYCIVSAGAVLGARTVLYSHVVIDGIVEVGQDNQFYQFCSIGAPPQDLGYKGDPTKVIIGDRNVFREYVSIHRGTLKEKGTTIIGNDSLFMAHVHLAHDVGVGNKCVFVNSVNLAGHVKIGDRVIIGGGTNISQFISLGRGAYIGGASGIDRDIPPFCTAYGNRAKLKGINIIGMRRQNFSRQEISDVVDFFRMMESSALSPRSFVEHREHFSDLLPNPVIEEMIAMIRVSEVGIPPFMS